MTQAAISTPTAARTRGYSTAWWGMVMLITTEAMIFLALLSSYFFVRAGASHWPLGAIKAPELTRSSIFTVVLLGSSIPIFWAESAIRRGHMHAVRIGLLLSFLMGSAFLGHSVWDFLDLEFKFNQNAYASLFFVIVGLHATHVFVGLLMSMVVQLKASLGKVTPERYLTLEVFSLYWHFVDGVWIFVFSSLFISPHLGR
jgi:heme/copper-type cytochrome/quinol oxidase subunit 3